MSCTKTDAVYQNVLDCQKKNGKFDIPVDSVLLEDTNW